MRNEARLRNAQRSHLNLMWISSLILELLRRLVEMQGGMICGYEHDHLLFTSPLLGTSSMKFLTIPLVIHILY